MAVPLKPATQTDRMLRRLEQEQKAESDGIGAAWAFLWVLFWFKIATVAIIFYAASGSGESLAMIAATTWYWLLIPVLAISGPLLVRWRMLKLRRRREQLRRLEWEVKPDVATIEVVHVPGDQRRQW